MLGQIERTARRALGRHCGRERLGVCIERGQRIGYVLKGCQDRDAILCPRLVQTRLGRVLPVFQRAEIEDRLRDRTGDTPELVVAGEHLRERDCRAAEDGGDGKLGQAIGDGNANQRARCVKLLFGGPDVRALLDDL